LASVTSHSGQLNIKVCGHASFPPDTSSIFGKTISGKTAQWFVNVAEIFKIGGSVVHLNLADQKFRERKKKRKLSCTWLEPESNGLLLQKPRPSLRYNECSCGVGVWTIHHRAFLNPLISLNVCKEFEVEKWFHLALEPFTIILVVQENQGENLLRPVGVESILPIKK
jgi:hypothetical protein